MKDVVLVHGAWHGGWCWRRVTDRLRAAGHRAYAPTLTGLADRGHLLQPSVTLETHVQDVIGLLEFEDIDDAVLCGHSYGGLVAAVVADRVPERIGHLVFLDALVPASGQSAMDLLGETEGVPDLLRQLAREAGDGWRVPPSAFTAEALGVDDPADAAWLSSRLTDHPLSTLEEPVDLAGGVDNVRRTFVRAEKFPATWADDLLAAAREDSGWEHHSIPAGHDLIVTHPDEVTEILLR
ncbi:alpha/beta fold hydrolase [Amycolatopsis jejuensis]|uniref:alpha/beta fold hydrolase n=1 Tax=Amycolatopsis jejuensis TaxID=330084 RepID=UPI00052453BD|nr:alpha/beta hydrolase [Amycolatopsis jejuensis]